MIYLKTKNSTVFAFDNETGVTFIFKNGKWKFSEIIYGILIQDEDIEEISEMQAKELTSGANIENILQKVRTVLDITI